MIEVAEANVGVVRLSNSAFWGPCNQIAKIDGRVLWASVTARSWMGRQAKRPSGASGRLGKPDREWMRVPEGAQAYRPGTQC
jgi:hypothetical protein